MLAAIQRRWLDFMPLLVGNPAGIRLGFSLSSMRPRWYVDEYHVGWFQSFAPDPVLRVRDLLWMRRMLPMFELASGLFPDGYTGDKLVYLLRS